MGSTDTARPARIAFVGCGSIAGPYARTLATHPELTLVGAHDLDPAAQADFTAAHGCAGYADLDALTADTPDVVVNLTSAAHHHATTRELIGRGHTVFSEKPLALRHDEATELVRLAAERDVRLACAPSLWLGAATQATAALVADDLVGPVRLITAEVNQGRIESWHPAPAAFYRVGPVVDAGVYPISFLTAVFGPVREVTATSTTVLADRRTLDGTPFPVVAPDTVIAVLRFAAGPVLRLSCTFYVDAATVPRSVELHGDRGSIRLADWVQPGSAVDHAEAGGPYREHTPADPAAAIDWSIGLLDLVQAIQEDRPHRAGAEHAAHVVEVLNAVETSAGTGAPVAVHSGFAPSTHAIPTGPIPTGPIPTDIEDISMTVISYMGANLVAQQLDWSMTEGWWQGDRAANEHYAPIETFPQRFAAFVRLVSESGFDSLDVWTGQLHWSWATPAHLAAARDVLERAGVRVTSYAGLFGDTSEEFAAACRVATGLGAPILSGNAGLLGADRVALVDLLEENDLVLAIENHPEHAAAEVLAKIGDGAGGRIGTAVDTGWWGTQGADSVQVLRELAGHVLHVHLKDIRAAGAHETCALGDGVVPVAACVAVLPEIGFSGPISIEHEPEHHDPAPEVAVSRTRLLDWLAATPVAR